MEVSDINVYITVLKHCDSTPYTVIKSLLSISPDEKDKGNQNS